MTAISGTSSASASIFAALTPMSSAPTSPGVLWTAIAPISFKSDLRRGEGFVDDRQQVAKVSPRRDLRHDAAEAGMQRFCDATTLDRISSSIREHRRGGFVAGGFEGEEVHRSGVRVLSMELGQSLLHLGVVVEVPVLTREIGIASQFAMFFFHRVVIGLVIGAPVACW